ncbi:MAG: hypothetical protein K2K21_08975 [Lachnospiraceae bacterium]|nr:hypothetical protein [Lachnospiraceae bacterium]
MKSSMLKKIGITFLVNFLLSFMLFIFGPSEIFFANAAEFDFVYGDFAGYMSVLAVAAAFILTLILGFLPDKLHRVLLSVIFGISIAGYIQVMFLNKNLDLLGLNPEGYKITPAQSIINLVIWIVIILAVIILALWKKDIWKKILQYISVFLLCIQLVALVSLLVTADEYAYHYQEGKWYLSGENQYVVSANKNVIVLVLDWFSNQYLEPLQAEYPGSTDFLHDFTYYSNMDCTYFGTFPSLPHMLTGNEVDSELTVNEWCAKIWEDDKSVDFYNELHDNNFVANLYTPDTNILCGLNSPEILDDTLSNVVNTADEIDIFYKLLFKTMFKMSAYRMFPESVKPYFYTNIDEYADVVSLRANKVYHNNYDFYQGLIEEGLSVDKKSNYYIVQHLMGPHLLTTNEFGAYKEDATLEETTKGCMVIVEEYLNQLKSLGVYDDAAIIITADHGGVSDSQVIFYIKEPGETHDVTPVTDAPVSFNEFLPTIAELAGLDYTKYGESIHDYDEDSIRERTVWIRWYDENYPTVPCYTGDKDGSSNVYYGYTYTGNIEDLLRKIEGTPDLIEEIVDSYF